MALLEERHYFDCPYCMSRLSILVDCSAGKNQSFTEDCAVCCRPIAIHLAVSIEGVVGFTAEQES